MEVVTGNRILWWLERGTWKKFCMYILIFTHHPLSTFSFCTVCIVVLNLVLSRLFFFLVFWLVWFFGADSTIFSRLFLGPSSTYIFIRHASAFSFVLKQSRPAHDSPESSPSNVWTDRRNNKCQAVWRQIVLSFRRNALDSYLASDPHSKQMAKVEMNSKGFKRYLHFVWSNLTAIGASTQSIRAFEMMWSWRQHFRQIFWTETKRRWIEMSQVNRHKMIQRQTLSKTPLRKRRQEKVEYKTK